MSEKIYFTEVVLLTKSYNLQDFKDWLHWHLDIIGFDHAHIFDNESSVDIKAVCDSYGDKVSYELVKGWPNQYALYNRYINNESKAWWVLPIDDDEFLYVSDKYENKIENCLLDVSMKHKDWCKVSVGWRNLFPREYTEERTNEHLILNATGWSDKASDIWQDGNRPVKTFVKLNQKYEWADKNGFHKTHNPFGGGDTHTLNGEVIVNSKQKAPTRGDEDLILFHYQYKSNQEWVWKCKNRKSPGAKWFNKDFPNVYKNLYNFNEIRTDGRMVKIWNG